MLEQGKRVRWEEWQRGEEHSVPTITPHCPSPCAAVGVEWSKNSWERSEAELGEMRMRELEKMPI